MSRSSFVVGKNQVSVTRPSIFLFLFLFVLQNAFIIHLSVDFANISVYIVSFKTYLNLILSHFIFGNKWTERRTDVRTDGRTVSECMFIWGCLNFASEVFGLMKYFMCSFIRLQVKIVWLFVPQLTPLPDEFARTTGNCFPVSGQNLRKQPSYTELLASPASSCSPSTQVKCRMNISVHISFKQWHFYWVTHIHFNLNWTRFFSVKVFECLTIWEKQ